MKSLNKNHLTYLLILISLTPYTGFAQSESEDLNIEVRQISQIINDTVNEVSLTFTFDFKDFEKISLSIGTTENGTEVFNRSFNLPLTDKDQSPDQLTFNDDECWIKLSGLKNGDFLMTLTVVVKDNETFISQKIIKI